MHACTSDLPTHAARAFVANTPAAHMLWSSSRTTRDAQVNILGRPGRRAYATTGETTRFIFPMAMGSASPRLPAVPPMRFPSPRRPDGSLYTMSPRTRSSDMIGSYYYHAAEPKPLQLQLQLGSVLGAVDLERSRQALFSRRAKAAHSFEMPDSATRRWHGGPRFEERASPRPWVREPAAAALLPFRSSLAVA